MKASNFGHFRASKLVQNCRITLLTFQWRSHQRRLWVSWGSGAKPVRNFKIDDLKKAISFGRGSHFYLLGPHFLPCEGLQKVGVLELQLHLNIVFLKIGSSKIHSMNIDIFESLLCIFDSYSITIYFQQDLTYVLHESFELIV